MNNISNQINTYSTFYNDLTSLKAVISLIPYVGSQLDLYLSAPGQKFVQQRLEFMIEQLQSDMNEIHEHLINKEIFGTEEHFDLVQKSFIASAKTRQKEKLKLFAKILRGSFLLINKDDDPELYLKIIDDLTEKELEVVLLIYDIKIIKKIESIIDNDGVEGDAYLISKHFPKYDKEDLEFIFPRLEKTGLVKELVGSYIGYGGGVYNPTSLLTNFIKFINGF